MRRAFIVAAGLALASGGIGRAWADPPESVGGVAPTEARSPEEERKSFHLPPGFEAQLVADETQIHKPMNIAFDDRGRLWVTETVEYPYPAKEGSKPRDAVKILDDFGPDGRARKVTTFADGLNIPIGLMPLGDGSSALVHSIPAIWRLTDTDGDGVADKREAVYQTFASQDTHGMTSNFTWGFDGWIYADHGFANSSEVKAADGSRLKMNSGNTYRMKADGSRIEQFTHGQVNPFGLSFSPMGDLYSADCHTKPLYCLLRGAYYPSFGKPDDGLGFAPEMVTHDHGSTAIDAALYYAAENFPKAFRDNLYVGNVVTNRINRDTIEWHGSTPKGIAQPDFLVADDPWFRPVSMQVGPDGALYVADFYNRIIGHYEVPLTHPGRDRTSGRIWRIFYNGPEVHAEAVAPRADWTKATTEELIQDLDHRNLVVRMKATNQLASAGGDSVIKALRKELHRAISADSSNGGRQIRWARVHALWALHRLDQLDEQDFEGIGAWEQTSWPHFMRVLSERPKWSTSIREQVLWGLRGINPGPQQAASDPLTQRAAADALGQHPAPENIKPLLDRRKAIPADDTHLVHVVKMALRNQLLKPENWKAAPGGDSKTAWEEWDYRWTAEVSLGIPTVEAARYLDGHIRRWPEPQEWLCKFIQHIARYGDKDTDASVLEFAKKDKPADLGHQAAILKAIHQGMQERGAPLGEPAQAWAGDVIVKLIHSGADSDLQAGIALAGAMKLKAASEALVALVRDRQAPDSRRGAAMGALAGIDAGQAVGPLAAVLDEATEPVGAREQAAATLAKLNQDASRAALLKALPAAPGRLQAAIAVGLAASSQGADELLTAVAAGKASARLFQDKAVVLRLQATKVPGLEDRLAKLLKGLPPAEQKLNELIERRRAAFAAAKPDAAAGEQVFAKTCAACHQLGGKGARIGPQLDGVGLRGADRLMEDILDPNRNVDQAFRTTSLALDDGQVASGLLLREEGDVLILADQQGKDVRVPKGKVEERATSQLSPMPANFGDQFPEGDFLNLIAYLLSQRPPTGEGERSATRP